MLAAVHCCGAWQTWASKVQSDSNLPLWCSQGAGLQVNAALADPEELQRKAALGLQAARQHFTCEAKLDRILDAAAEHKAGFRGFSFPFGFRLGCHSYHTSDNRPSAAWCSQRQ